MILHTFELIARLGGMILHNYYLIIYYLLFNEHDTHIFNYLK